MAGSHGAIADQFDCADMLSRVGRLRVRGHRDNPARRKTTFILLDNIIIIYGNDKYVDYFVVEACNRAQSSHHQ